MKRLIIFVLGFFISCSPPTISSNSDKSVDFSQFKTFCFANYQEAEVTLRPDYDNAENHEIIKAAIIEALAKVGYTNVEKGSDLMIQYDMLINEKVDPRVDSAVIYKPWVVARNDTFNYTEGLLIVRIIDRKKDKMIWQGSLSGILNRKPETFGKHLDNYIAELFESLAEQAQ